METIRKASYEGLISVCLVRLSRLRLYLVSQFDLRSSIWRE